MEEGMDLLDIVNDKTRFSNEFYAEAMIRNL
jgi:hypothetical protein